MRFGLLAFICACGALHAQTPPASIRPSVSNGNQTFANEAGSNQAPTKSKLKIFLPAFGFLIDPSGGGLTAIRGTVSSPVLGETIAKPSGVTAIYLPPREHYALVEESSPESIAVWHLARRHVTETGDVMDALPGALLHPDSVVFSPKGTAVALFSRAFSKWQIIAGLPGTPSIKGEVSASNLGQLASIALSDDGQILLGVSSSGQMSVSSDGKTLRSVPGYYSPMALTFVATTHDVVISDAQQKQLVLIETVEAQALPHVLGTNLQPDHLATCGDGELLIALDAAHQQLWEIDTKAFNVTPVALSQSADALAILRDGHTFLISDSPLALLKTPDLNSSPQVSVRSGAIAAAGSQY
ncbi:MAG: hypothetical protein JO051_09545 [Acidobacteriaceae bacterium]|nr:hypothetical protein [Acidobacteriaceae bacterium]